jgi:hypothetical protein
LYFKNGCFSGGEYSMSAKSKEDNEKKGCYLSTAFGSLIVVAIVEWIWPDVIPFTMFQFWKFDGTVGEVLRASWPVFLWGIGATALFAWLKWNDSYAGWDDVLDWREGLLTSAFAGTMEEISFRWLIFFDEIVGYKIANWLIFGWAGFGLFEWLHLHIAAPIANFFTLGALEPVLFGSFGWAAGAALLTSNGKFRDGHIYNGLIGWINSWFMGMFFFYMMFEYGIIAGMLVHFLYDAFIKILLYVLATIRLETRVSMRRYR